MYININKYINGSGNGKNIPVGHITTHYVEHLKRNKMNVANLCGLCKNASTGTKPNPILWPLM